MKIVAKVGGSRTEAAGGKEVGSVIKHVVGLNENGAVVCLRFRVRETNCYWIIVDIANAGHQLGHLRRVNKAHGWEKVLEGRSVVGDTRVEALVGFHKVLEGRLRDAELGASSIRNQLAAVSRLEEAECSA